MLQLHESSEIRGVVARVIVPRESNADATVLINAGSKDGIVEGFPVVDPDGLIGVVEEVSLTSSRVRLLIDTRFGAGARLAQSRDVGAVVGDGSETLSLRLIDPRVQAQVGELVVTSGAAGGSAFPPNISIGRVASVDAPEGSLESRIKVDPSVNLSRLEYVRVLIYRGEG
jgi:rod shape-determining protein MreC